MPKVDFLLKSRKSQSLPQHLSPVPLNQPTEQNTYERSRCLFTLAVPELLICSHVQSAVPVTASPLTGGPAELRPWGDTAWRSLPPVSQCSQDVQPGILGYSGSHQSFCGHRGEGLLHNPTPLFLQDEPSLGSQAGSLMVNLAVCSVMGFPKSLPWQPIE